MNLIKTLIRQNYESVNCEREVNIKQLSIKKKLKSYRYLNISKVFENDNEEGQF